MSMAASIPGRRLVFDSPRKSGVPSFVSHQPSAISHQPSAISHFAVSHSSRPMSSHESAPTAAPEMRLGVAGYAFSDLYDPERLASLYERFCEEVQAADPAFWREWDAYRAGPDAPRTPQAHSTLLTGMAPHVSRFVTRLFDVDRDAASISAATHAQDDLFRFKVDFVRRRALPLVKGDKPIARTAEDDAVVERLMAAQ